LEEEQRVHPRALPGRDHLRVSLAQASAGRDRKSWSSNQRRREDAAAHRVSVRRARRPVRRGPPLRRADRRDHARARDAQGEDLAIARQERARAASLARRGRPRGRASFSRGLDGFRSRRRRLGRLESGCGRASRARRRRRSVSADAHVRKGFKRKDPPPPLESEPLEIRTADGVTLSATVYEPASQPRGMVVMAHAMFARQSAFRWLAPAYRDRGWRVVTFDFRGHGRSAIASPQAGAPGSRWGYDDFVERDLPAVVECVRARSDGPVALLGHSLGGHVALAAQGCGLVKLDAIVLVAANIWLRDFEPNAAMWAAKRVVLEGFVRTARRVGKFPARALRLGSDDESLDYVEDLARFAFDGRWV